MAYSPPVPSAVVPPAVNPTFWFQQLVTPTTPYLPTVTWKDTLNKSAEASADQQLSVAAQNQPIPIIYGQARVGPKIAYVTTYSGKLFVLGVWCHGPVDSFPTKWADDKTPLPNTIAVEDHLGEATQVASAELGAYIGPTYGTVTTFTGVVITSTRGEFTYTNTATSCVVGQTVTISGTMGGTGSITGYVNPTTYYVINTNGTNNFTLSATYNGTALVTTIGTPSGLTYVGAKDRLVSPPVAYSVFTIQPTVTDSKTNYGFPRINYLVKGIKPYDPRLEGTKPLSNPSSWQWSANPALCLADFLSNTVYGCGYQVDWASVTTVADFNDTAPARTLNICLDSAQASEAWIDTLRTYASCWVVISNGVAKLIPDRAGNQVASYYHASGSIKDIGNINKRGVMDVPNYLTVNYTDTSVVPYRSAPVVVDVSQGTTLRESIVALPGINTYAQASREGIERLNKLRLNDLSLDLAVFDEGLKVELGDIVGVVHPIGIGSSTTNLALNSEAVNGVDNWVPYSENIENAAWTKINLTSANTGEVAFDYGLTSLTLTGGTAVSHYYYEPITALPDNTDVWGSIYVDVTNLTTKTIIAQYVRKNTTPSYAVCTFQWTGVQSANMTGIGGTLLDRRIDYLGDYKAIIWVKFNTGSGSATPQHLHYIGSFGPYSGDGQVVKTSRAQLSLASNSLVYGRTYSVKLSPIASAWAGSNAVFTQNFSQLLTNGTFDSNVTGWVNDAPGTITWNAGRADCNSGSGSNVLLRQNVPTVPGLEYTVTYDRLTGGQNTAVYIYSPSFQSSSFNGGTGTFSYTFTAGDPSTRVEICGGSANAAQILDNISCLPTGARLVESVTIATATTHAIIGPRTTISPGTTYTTTVKVKPYSTPRNWIALQGDGGNSNLGPAQWFQIAPVAITGLVITDTAGQCTCASTSLWVGQQITISGTFGGTGSIAGYVNPTTYRIAGVAAGLGTAFTLTTTAGGVTTTTGTPTGLTITSPVQVGDLATGVSSASLTALSDGYYRAAVTATALPVGLGGTRSADPKLFLSTGQNVSSYVGVTNTGVWFSALQIEEGASFTTYVPTTSTAVTVNYPKLMRTMGIENTGAGRYTLKLVEYDPAVYSSTSATQPTYADINAPDPYATSTFTLGGVSVTEQLFVGVAGNVDSRFQVSWTPISDLFTLKYVVKVTRYDDSTNATSGTTLGNPVIVVNNVEVNGSPFMVSPLDHKAGSYYYRIEVRAVRDGYNVFSNTSVAIAQELGKTLAPTFTSTPTTTISPTTGVKLDWASAIDSDLMGYNIYDGATLIQTLGIQNTTVIPYSQATMTGGAATAHTYKVVAFDSVPNYSTTQSAAVITISPQAAVGSFVSTKNDVIQTLSWVTPASGTWPIDYYDLRVGGTSFGTATPISKVKTNSFSRPFDSSDYATRIWRIVPVDIANNLGTESTVTVTSSGVTAPTGLTKTINGDYLTLSWTPPTVDANTQFPLKQYEIYKTASSVAIIPAGASTATSISRDFYIDWQNASRTWSVAAFDKVAGTASSTASVAVSINTLTAVTVNAPTIVGDSAYITWAAVITGDSNNTLPVVKYEVRKGSSWGTGTTVAITQGLATTSLITSPGSQTYWVAAYDRIGATTNTPGATTGNAVLTVNVPSTVSGLTATVVDNNVSLKWTSPTPNTSQLPIAAYEIKRGSSWAAGTSLGRVGKGAEFKSILESVGGTFTYWIKAIDTAGNAAADGSAASVSAVVSQPPDYVLNTAWTSVFANGGPVTGSTAVNISVDTDGSRLIGVDNTETWANHFSGLRIGSPPSVNAGGTGYAVGDIVELDQTAIGSQKGRFSVAAVTGGVASGFMGIVHPGNYTAVPTTLTTTAVTGTGSGLTIVSPTSAAAWSTPQAQINAGFATYIQPGLPSGSYQEQYDYGTTLSTSTKVTVTTTGLAAGGSPTVSVDLYVSPDGSTWRTYIGQSSIIESVFRYVKYKVNVSGGIYDLSQLSLTLDAKIKNDAGMIGTTATSAIVNFNTVFTDVSSITLSAGTGTGTVPTLTYNFKDSVFVGTYDITSNILTVNATAHGQIAGQNVKLNFTSGTGVSGVYTIATAATNSYTIAVTAANTTGNVSSYSQSFIAYAFNSSGTPIAITSASWSVKGY